MEEMAGRIAIIGWGSLLWDLDDLAPKIEGPWMMRAGPSLPFEFSRVSPKRKLALVLCLDPEQGAPCPTNAILSTRADIHAAAEDLRARERAKKIGFIGAFCARTGFHRSRLPEITPLFAEWCEATGAAGAVWTDLESNFRATRGADFSIPAAIAYLRTLTGEAFDEAVRYVERAPETTETPLRAALRADPWWRGEVLRRNAAG